MSSIYVCTPSSHQLYIIFNSRNCDIVFNYLLIYSIFIYLILAVYVYPLSYAEVMDPSTNPSPLMWFDNTTHNLLRAADCYGLERLKAICETKLCLDIDVKSVMVILLLADQHKCDMLKQACFSFIAAPNSLETVIGTPEYHQFKSLYPILLIEVLENVCILRK